MARNFRSGLRVRRAQMEHLEGQKCGQSPDHKRAMTMLGIGLETEQAQTSTARGEVAELVQLGLRFEGAKVCTEDGSHPRVPPRTRRGASLRRSTKAAEVYVADAGLGEGGGQSGLAEPRAPRARDRPHIHQELDPRGPERAEKRFHRRSLVADRRDRDALSR